MSSLYLHYDREPLVRVVMNGGRLFFENSLEGHSNKGNISLRYLKNESIIHLRAECIEDGNSIDMLYSWLRPTKQRILTVSESGLFYTGKRRTKKINIEFKISESLNNRDVHQRKLLETVSAKHILTDLNGDLPKMVGYHQKRIFSELGSITTKVTPLDFLGIYRALQYQL